MIIHINGLPGSVKTTLGKELSNLLNIDVVNTDDIYNLNALKILSKYNFETGGIGRACKDYDHELLKINQEDLNKIIEKYTDKNLIITGENHGMNMNIDKGFYIKKDNDLHYKQYNMRLLESINEHYDDIKEKLNSDISSLSKEIEISIKYKITGPFMAPYSQWRDFDSFSKEKSKKIGYKYATYNEIIKEIEQIFITDNL